MVGRLKEENTREASQSLHCIKIHTSLGKEIRPNSSVNARQCAFDHGLPPCVALAAK